MRREGLILPIIVVIIPNHIIPGVENSRDHDFTPTPAAEMPRSGGASEFLRFFKTELLPYIDHRYPANGTHLVHGHSLGGLFLMYALASDPGVFDGYVALEPAMHWNHRALDPVFSEKIPGVSGKGKAVFIGGRSGSAYSEMGLDSLESILRARASSGLHWKMVAYEDENHNTVKLKGTYDGLRYVYGGYSQDPVEFLPSRGVLLAGQPFQVLTSWERPHLHYTSDGSEPGESSPEVQDGAVPVEDPRKIRLRLVSNLGVFDRELPLALQAGEAIAPEGEQVAAPIDGLWHFALCPPEEWPHLASGHPFAQGEGAGEINLDTPGRKRFAGKFRRDIEISEEGYYVFGIRGKGRLSLGSHQILESDGTPESGWQGYVAPLRSGRYLLTFEVLKEGEDLRPQLTVMRTTAGQPKWWKSPPWLALDLMTR